MIRLAEVLGKAASTAAAPFALKAGLFAIGVITGGLDAARRLACVATWRELPMMMTANGTSKLLTFVVLSWLVAVPLGSRAAQSAVQSHVCDRVTIDSVTNEVGIWHDEIVVFSRLRGLTGPIMWVRIVPPEQSNTDNKIREMILVWDSHPMAGTGCSVGIAMDQKLGTMCSESVPGTQLRLSVTFEPSAHGTEKQTEKLTKYISDEVLCTLSPRPRSGAEKENLRRHWSTIGLSALRLAKALGKAEETQCSEAC